MLMGGMYVVQMLYMLAFPFLKSLQAIAECLSGS